MSEKIKMPKNNTVLETKKDRGRKEQHCLMFYNDIWQSINEHAKLYGVSASEYLETLQQLYLEANKNK